MKIKINLFRKIFLFSIFLIIFTISVSYILSIFAADSFYINRRKSEIIKIKDNIKNFSDNEYALEEYIENVKDKEGINIYIENSMKPESHHKKSRSRYRKVENGFHIISMQNNIILLVYKENISKNEIVFITTSLSVMSSHRHEVYLLNLITLVVALGISAFISRIFAKRITDNIGALNRAAKKIAELDFSEKSNINTSDELKDLSRSINIMADSISSSIEGLNNFVSNASHELKTPIAVIDTHAQLLLAGKITEEKERKNYYRVILKESRYMNTLVKDLLLISKLSSADTKLSEEKFELHEVIRKSIEQFEFLELKKDIEWEIDIDEKEVTANKKLIEIVFNNIIQNALKYSPENSKIKIYREGNNIVIENPMYIKEIEKTDKLFEPFFRGNNGTEKGIEGSGLGLSLIKRILSLHSFEYGIKIKNNKFIFYFDIFR